MPPKPPNLLALIAAFDREGVDFVVVGGMAMILHGSTHVTMDTDFAVATDPGNTSPIVRALAPFTPVPSHLGEGFPFVWDERSIFGTVISLITSVGDVDLLRECPGIDSFADLKARSEERVLAGHAVRVASLRDLIAMKRASTRDKDRMHLVELEKLLEMEIDGQG